METSQKFRSATINVTVKAAVSEVWEYWNNPEHIIKWYYASHDWHCPAATNDLKPSGKFKYRMESFDGNMGFDYEGVYDTVEENRAIGYSLADGRKVNIVFDADGDHTAITETFDLENENPADMQRQGWQAILNNFKKYVESAKVNVPLSFDVIIEAPSADVYKNLIDKDGYREWTKIFNKDSHYEGSWDKGSKILFVGTDDKGNKGGMVSFIEENIPGKYISIIHRGILSGEQEIMEGPEVDSWSGVYERYILTENNGSTTLKVSVESNEEFKDYFSQTFPKALNVLKTICEEK